MDVLIVLIYFLLSTFALISNFPDYFVGNIYRSVNLDFITSNIQAYIIIKEKF